MKRTTLLAACTLAVTMGIVAPAYAQRLDAPVTRDIYFTFSQPVAVPNMTLPAGKYLFRVVGESRTIVQIYSGDRSKLIHTAMSVQTARSDQPEKPEIRLIESSANTPVAIATWWYPEMRQGWEFVYPRAQAMQLAKTAKQPILTTASNTASSESVNEGDLVRLQPSGQQSAYSSSAAAQPAAGMAQIGEVAAADAQANQVAAASQPSNSMARAQTTRTALPRTASERPTIALAGIIALAAVLAIRLRRQAQA